MSKFLNHDINALASAVSAAAEIQISADNDMVHASGQFLPQADLTLVNTLVSSDILQLTKISIYFRSLTNRIKIWSHFPSIFSKILVETFIIKTRYLSLNLS